MKKVVLFFALAVGLLASASTAMAQANMSRYITLTVKNGEDIKLDFKAAAAGTPVRIVSGSNMVDITAGTSWYGTDAFVAEGSTMTIYGDLTDFDCSGNGANVIALDPSHNTQLKWLSCSDNTLTSLDLSHNTQLEKLYCNKNQLTSLDLSHNTQLKQLFCDDNNFSTQALDDIYCTLPLRKASDLAVICPIYNTSSSNHATVLATNAQNAINKHWNVRKYKDDGNYTDINTTGSYDCASTGIDEASSEEAISIYPNPTDNELHLSTSAQEVRIYNMYGIEVTRAANTDRLAVSHLPKGVYLVHADEAVLKMIKQ